MTAGRRRGLGVAALVSLAAGLLIPSTAASSTLSVRLTPGAAKTVLRLQPGFATVLRSDRRIDTVAIGDPRLVSAATVKRGADVYDIVLQPQATNGTTNMIVWLGENTSVWELIISAGLRTADIVFLITAPANPGKTGPPVQTGASRPSLRDSGPAAPAEPGSQTVLSEAPAPAPPPASLEAQQTLKDASAAFELFRTRSGVKLRYRITNQGDFALAIRPNGVVVEANGRVVPFALAVDGGDRTKPTLLSPGATNTGVISAVIPAPRQVRLIFSVFPISQDRGGGAPSMPTTFQFVFVDVQQLLPAKN